MHFITDLSENITFMRKLNTVSLKMEAFIILTHIAAKFKRLFFLEIAQFKQLPSADHLFSNI
ncbi:hypothetical protein QTP88_012356 [Uroleucon formosanum]